MGEVVTTAVWHLDGAGGQTSFPEVWGRTLASYGDARISAAQSKFGGASLLLNGITSFAYSNDPTAWRMSGDDFTLECFIRLRSPATARQEIFSFFNAYGYGMQIADTGGLRAFATTPGGAVVVGPGSSVVTAEVWHHVAFAREDSTLRIFLDGVLQAAAAVADSIDPAGPATFVVGRDSIADIRYFDGHIDEIRVTRGLARYTADFTPPTEPFTVEPLRIIMVEDESLDAGGRPAVSFTGVMPNFPAKLYRNFHILGAEARLIGTVKEKHTPENTPLRRRVRLIRERDGATVGQTWSDAGTGAYVFTNIDSAETYSVIAYDHEHKYRAVVADGLTTAGGGVELVE